MDERAGLDGRTARRPTTAALLAALLTVAATCSGDAPARRAAAPPGGDIVLITIDTLRADHVGLYGYERPTTPELDAFFGEGLVYERSYSTEASTSPSVISLLTGRLPQDHGVRLLYQLVSPEVPLITEQLPDAYQTAAFVSNLVLTREALGIGERFDHYDDFVDQRESRRKVFERNAERTTDATLAWVATQADPERPLFLWVHYIDPHGPYRPPDDFESGFTHLEPELIDIERVPAYIREDGPPNGLDYVDRYDAELAYMDAHVGRLLDGLDAVRSTDDALVVFTADHGESMMEHERWFTHGYHVYEELVRVPLLLRGPGVAPGRSDRLTSGTDVAPTLLRFAGGELTAGQPDVDLRAPESLTPDRYVFTEATNADHQWRAALRGDDKWVVKLGGERGRITERLRYDLASDPAESAATPWSETEPGSTALLDAIAADPDPAGMPEQFREGVRLDAPKVAPGLDDEALEALRALGYVR